MEGKEKYEKPNKTNVYKKRKKIEDFPSAMNEKGKLAPTNRGFKKKQTISRSERKKKRPGGLGYPQDEYIWADHIGPWEILVHWAAY